MKETGILFSAPMVRAILDGRKTQTRRIVKPQPHRDLFHLECVNGIWADEDVSLGQCRYGQPGDKLWVRETFRPDDYAPEDWPRIIYRADVPEEVLRETKGVIRWKPAIHLPREGSRITLEITDIRVERVQEITHRDCVAEGLDHVSLAGGHAHGEFTKIPGWHVRAVQLYRKLWDSINVKRGFSWESNPWVWVIQFRKIKP